jgi:hypothetical protein
VACLSSLILVVLCAQSRDDDFLAKVRALMVSCVVSCCSVLCGALLAVLCGGSCAVGPVRWVLCVVMLCSVWALGGLSPGLPLRLHLSVPPTPPPPSHTPLHLHAPSVQVIGRYRVPNPAGCPAPHDTPHRFVSWGEAQTMIYLKISLSDFFTVFAARCRSWCVAHARPHTHADAHTGIPHVAT